jgi:hypothetical protein
MSALDMNPFPDASDDDDIPVTVMLSRTQAQRLEQLAVLCGAAMQDESTLPDLVFLAGLEALEKVAQSNPETTP